MRATASAGADDLWSCTLACRTVLGHNGRVKVQTRRPCTRCSSGDGRMRRAVARARPERTAPAHSAPGSGRRTRPLDPRLLRYAESTRRFIVLAMAAAPRAPPWSSPRPGSSPTAGPMVPSTTGRCRRCAAPSSFLLAGHLWGGPGLGDRVGRPPASANELRHSAAGHIAALGPGGLDRQGGGRLSAPRRRASYVLDGYFSCDPPQLFLAVIVPVTIIAVVAGADWISAALIAVAAPIPVFMGLVGLTTRDRTAARTTAVVAAAGGHFLRRHGGSPTLKVFGRAKAQARRRLPRSPTAIGPRRWPRSS